MNFSTIWGDFGHIPGEVNQLLHKDYWLFWLQIAYPDSEFDIVKHGIKSSRVQSVCDLLIRHFDLFIRVRDNCLFLWKINSVNTVVVGKMHFDPPSTHLSNIFDWSFQDGSLFSVTLFWLICVLVVLGNWSIGCIISHKHNLWLSSMLWGLCCYRPWTFSNIWGDFGGIYQVK